MGKKDIIILSIETTCDDTAIAICKYSNDSFSVLSNIISSQIKDHNPFGGVVPELASREHIKNIIPVLDKAISEANIKLNDLDYIALTNKGGGLVGSIIVGIETAKTLSYLLNIPIISVNHKRGHVLVSMIKNIDNNKYEVIEPEFPMMTLTVSGGHTQIILIKNFIEWEVVGQTLDDAAGECYDKVSKILNLGYPGGPIISKMATTGDKTKIKFPRPMIGSGDFNFSFSGLKTAVLYETEKIKKENLKISVDDVCASAQDAINDILTRKSLKAIEKYSPKIFILAGGVSANRDLRDRLKNEIEKNTESKFMMPEIPNCMDNALMINIAAYFNLKNNIGIYNYKDIEMSIERKV